MFNARFKVVMAAGIATTLIAATFVTQAEEPDNETPVTGTIALPNAGDREAAYASMAKITLQQAVDAALSRQSGKILKAELQDENGFLIFAVEIATPDNKVHEITVDAGNGFVLKSEADSSDNESESGDESN